MRALVVVDMQRDFIGGSLPVPGAEKLLPIINQHVKNFREYGDLVVYTRDWHPKGHCSFKDFPAHCVQYTLGAEFHPDLIVEGPIFSKGMNEKMEQFSAAHPEGPMSSMLSRLCPDKVYVCGVATEYCVQATALHLRRSFDGKTRVVVLESAIAAVNPKAAFVSIAGLLENGVEFA